jgi:DNA-binding transcriptional ArsR family regulator
MVAMNDALRRFKADIFAALAHPTRIAILELLSEGELAAGELNRRLGMEQANVSAHLGILRVKQLVSTRKVGNQVFYSMRDSRIASVLELMRTYFHAHLNESMDMLSEMQRIPETGT